MLFICTAWAYAISCRSPKPAPLFVRITAVLWYIVQPMSLNLVLGQKRSLHVVTVVTSTWTQNIVPGSFASIWRWLHASHDCLPMHSQCSLFIHMYSIAFHAIWIHNKNSWLSISMALQPCSARAKQFQHPQKNCQDNQGDPRLQGSLCQGHDGKLIEKSHRIKNHATERTSRAHAEDHEGIKSRLWMVVVTRHCCITRVLFVGGCSWSIVPSCVQRKK